MNTKLLAIVSAILIGLSGFALASNVTWTKDGFIAGTDAQKVLPYAYLAADAYRMESKPVTGFELVPYAELPSVLQKYYTGTETSAKTGFSYSACMLADKDSGMQARLYKAIDSNTYVLAFSGSDISASTRGAYNLMTNVGNAAGFESSVYGQADEWMQSVINQYPGACVIATGTSLGGGLAQYAVLMNRIQRTQELQKGNLAVPNNVKAYCFNAPGLTGAQLGDVIQANKIPASDPQNPSSTALKLMDAIARPMVTHVYVEGEWVSGYHPGYWFGKQYTVRFYDQSWSGYYTKSHHDAYAVRRSLEKAAGVTTEVSTGTQKSATPSRPGVLVNEDTGVFSGNNVTSVGAVNGN